MTTSSQDLFARHMAALTRPNASPAPTADELWSELRRLLPCPERINVLDSSDDPDAPEAWSVWIDVDGSGSPGWQDVIGAGATRSEALADAISTVRAWEN